MAYGVFQDLTRRTASDKILRDKTFNIAKTPVYKIFDKKTSGSSIKNENISKKRVGEELHKPNIRKFKKRKVHFPFQDNIWGADLVDIQ